MRPSGQQMPPHGQPPYAHSAEYEPATGASGAERKGFLSALFDLSFDRSVTARLVRLGYLLAILLITASSFALLIFGLWVIQYGWLLGLLVIVATPVVWVFQLVLVRIFLEFVVNQFRITEELQAIRRGDAGR